jgi:hypothetical protein
LFGQSLISCFFHKPAAVYFVLQEKYSIELTPDLIGKGVKKSNASGLLRCLDRLPRACACSDRVKKKKQNSQRPRPSVESVWGRASARVSRRAEARRPSVVRRLIGPFQFWPNFRIIKKGGRACTRRTYIYIYKRQTTLSVSRRRRAAMCFRRRISLP